MNSIPTISDEMFLRAVELEDIPEIRRQRNDPAMRAMFRQWREIGELEQRAWWEAMCNPGQGPGNPSAPAHYPRSVFVGASQRLGGVAGPMYIDWVSRRAEVSLFLFKWVPKRQGVGRAVLEEVHRHAFGEMGLHRLTAEVFIFNEPSMRLFQAAGYTYEGACREHHFHRGQWWDCSMFGLIAAEWYSGQRAVTP